MGRPSLITHLPVDVVPEQVVEHADPDLQAKVEQDLDFIIYYFKTTRFQVPYGPLNL